LAVTHTTFRHCEEPLGDEAIQGDGAVLAALDCFVAALLAMTGKV
jgi:hypothetical protein